MVPEPWWIQVQGDQRSPEETPLAAKVFFFIKVTSSYFKVEKKLNDASNFGLWKTRPDIILEEQEVLEYVEYIVAEPPENASVVLKSKHLKGETKARKIIHDSLSDHSVFCIELSSFYKEILNFL